MERRPPAYELAFPENLLRDLGYPTKKLKKDQLDGLLYAMCALNERQKEVFTMRYIRGMVNPAIGKELGVSRMRVGQILDDALAALEAFGVKDYLKHGLTGMMKRQQTAKEKRLREMSDFLSCSITDLGASEPLVRVLRRNGIKTGRDLIKVIDSDQWKDAPPRGLGHSKMLELCEIMARYVR